MAQKTTLPADERHWLEIYRIAKRGALVRPDYYLTDRVDALVHYVNAIPELREAIEERCN